MITDKPNSVVIVGGGFAGTTLARKLERTLDPAWDIFLLTRSNQLTYNPLLAEVVGGALLPGHVVAPIRLMLSRTRIRMVTVNRIIPERSVVSYSGVRAGELRYQHLVLAMGLAANDDVVPGMANHGLPLKTLGDALYLRNEVVRRMEEATLTRDAARRRWLMTFIVVGGGFSGVETAGEILDFIRSARRFYRNIGAEDGRVLLLQRGARLLPEISPELGSYTERILKKRGVDVRLEAQVDHVELGAVFLRGGERVAGATIVSTIGNAPHQLVKASAFPTVRDRLITTPELRVQGFDNVWAVGDCARIPNLHDGQYCPPTAQFATQQARALARNLLAETRGVSLQPFRYRPRGQIAAIGQHHAVAELFGWHLHGFGTWLLWRALYLFKIPTLAAKVRVFFEWNWSMVFPRDLSYLSFERTREMRSRDASHAGEAGVD